MPFYCEQVPTPSLAEWVACVWSLESDVAVDGYSVPPDGCLDIVYERHNGVRVVGGMTTRQHFDFPDGACLAGVRFRPGMAAPFLGTSAEQLTDRAVPLDDLHPTAARQLMRKLDDAKSIRDAMRHMLADLRIPAEAPNPVQRAIAEMTAANGNIDLDNVARQASLSPRQFRRRCLEASGLTPKFLCRVLRFRYVWRCLTEARKPDWSAIALDAGYFDQAHLIRDFHDFAGATPMAELSNTHARRSG